MIVFLHHSVNPYRVAFFNRLAERKKVPFKVYFLAKPAANRKWKVEDFNLNFEHTFLEGKKIYIPGNDHAYFHFNWGLIKELKNDQPKIVVTYGWNFLATWTTRLYCLMNKIDFVIFSESTKNEKSIQRFLTKPLVAWLVKSSDFLVPMGTRAKNYFLSLGARKSKIKNVPSSIDTEFFISKIDSLKSSQKALKRELSIPSSDQLVLYVGQIIKRKGLIELLELAKLTKNEKISFLLIGYGPLFNEIKKISQSEKLKIVQLKYVPNQEVIKYYALADSFILLSREDTWGLVVNEAMSAKLPVIVSKYAGVSEDLVHNDVNGWVVDPKNSEDIKNKLIKLNKPALRKKMGEKSREILRQKSSFIYHCEAVEELYLK